MWLWVLPFVGGGLCLYVYGRHNVAAVMRDWETVLTPGGRRAVVALAERVRLDASMSDYAYASATRARERGATDEAIRLLDLAFSVLEEATPDRLRRLKGMAVCCRMVAAMVPLPPLSPRAFRLQQLWTLTGAAAIVHQFLVSTNERFRLRLHVLAWAFRLVVGVMRHSVGTVKAGSPRAGAAAWTRFSAARDDFRSLDQEHLQAFRALMASLVATCD